MTGVSRALLALAVVLAGIMACSMPQDPANRSLPEQVKTQVALPQATGTPVVLDSCEMWVELTHTHLPEGANAYTALEVLLRVTEGTCPPLWYVLSPEGSNPTLLTFDGEYATVTIGGDGTSSFELYTDYDLTSSCTVISSEAYYVEILDASGLPAWRTLQEWKCVENTALEGW